jgi:hypothetical protein
VPQADSARLEEDPRLTRGRGVAQADEADAPLPFGDMTTEEREFRFARAAPLRGWRLFRVRPTADRLILSSPMYHDPDPTPWPGAMHTAVCYEGHPAPAAGCRCGVYAVVHGALDSLPGYLHDTAHDDDPWAYAEIACSGRVFVDMRGVRAEHAEILRIAVAESSWPDEAATAAAKRLLAARYGVPVAGLEDVPDWVTGNRRAQGPPPDEAILDLGALDLTSRRST